jgi:FMN reductase
MEDKLKIVGIGGSLEKNSTTYSVLKFTMQELELLGAEVLIYDPAHFDLPLYNPSHGIKQGGKELNKYLHDIRLADGYVFASPEYHGTVSAAFKNLVDYLEFLSKNNPPYLSGKPAGAIATGGGDVSGSATLLTMVSIIQSLRAVSVSSNVAVSSSQLHIESGDIKSETIKRRLKRLAAEIYTLAQKLK